MRHTSKTSGHLADLMAPTSVALASQPARLDAVIIRNLTYEAGRGRRRKTILNQINLTVPEGSIYGLLGPSGCGKTTMLRCMVGRLRPKAGSVLVFGLEPGGGRGEVPGRDVGYMPQEISIYEDFTIGETLQYFGRINRMPGAEIERRLDFLLQFLDLPSKKRTVANLSGGQKRRVSLAAALVHSPPLLILDEPTVGVDPLLRQGIWQHLVAMTRSERISVIITTHYIEEARLANVVGLMRNGRLLAEDSPEELMHQNGLANLEDVFLKLCMSDSSKRAAGAQRAAGRAKLDGQARTLHANSARALPFQHDERRAHQKRHSDSGENPARRLQLAAGQHFRQRKTLSPAIDGGATSLSPLEARLVAAGQQSSAQSRTSAAANRTTVRINTTTNKIELLNGAHTNEAIENFSSEEEEDDDDDDDGGKFSGVGAAEEHEYEHEHRLDGLAATQVARHAADSLLSGSSAAADDDESTENYLALQHMHWASRRAHLANLMRLTGRRLNKGPYLGLDGRRAQRMTAAESYSASHYEKPGGFLQWWETLTAVTWKNYVRLRRNPPVLVFQFMLPAIQVILFCLCIGGEPFDVPVAVVNDELVPKSSLEFLSGLNRRVIRQISYDNLSSAIEAVRRGHVWGAIHIPEKYTENLQSRLLMGEEVTNETISNGTIRLYPDLTNLHLAMTLENTFREAFVEFAKNSLEERGYDRMLAESPIQIARPIYGTLRKDGYLEFMAPGVVISISYVMATGLTALAFILERRDGLLERSLVSGVGTSQILLAHAINQVFVMTIQIFLVLGCTFFIFEIPSRGPFFWVVLLILLQGCTGMAFGLLVSAICAEENTAVMMVVGTFYTNLILAGIIWPIEAMPHWLRPVSWAQPQTLPTDTLRHILSRGWSVSEPGVLLGFAVTIGWLVVFLLSAGLIFKYSR